MIFDNEMEICFFFRKLVKQGGKRPPATSISPLATKFHMVTDP